jgi:hypothetical protein
MKDQRDANENRETALKEYELLINLYIHEDNFALRVMELSIILNSALTAAAKFGPEIPEVNIVIAVLGMAVCVGWRLMSTSAKLHHDLRAFRAREIETELGRKGTFHDEAAIFYYQKPVLFHDLHEPEKPQVFQPMALKRVFTVMESLPIVIGSAWLVFLVLSVIQALQAFGLL